MIKDLRSESEEIAMRRLVLKWTHERLSDSRGKPEVAMKDPDFYRNLPKSIAEKARMMDKDRIASIKDQGRPR